MEMVNFLYCTVVLPICTVIRGPPVILGKNKPSNTPKFISVLFLATCFGFSEKVIIRQLGNIKQNNKIQPIIFRRKQDHCRSQWPRGLRRRSLAARLLRLWIRIPPRAWMFVCCECCVLSGRGLCDGLITRLEESYRLWRVVVCDHETS